MDWFQVTDIWPEKQNGKICYKFRFEKIDLTTKSWWAPAGSSLPSLARSGTVKAPKIQCGACGVESKQIYRQGWMCLNHECDQFWTLNGRDSPSNLAFSPAFLEERTQSPAMANPGSLRPALLSPDPTNPSQATSVAAWKGIVCPRCGRCSSKTLWASWNCRDPKCGFSYQIPFTALSAAAVLSNNEIEYTGHATPLDSYAFPVTQRPPVFAGHWRIHTYDIAPGCWVTHFHANSHINKQPGGPHDMFRALQEENLGLQRFPLTNAPGKITVRHSSSFGC